MTHRLSLHIAVYCMDLPFPGRQSSLSTAMNAD